MGAAAVIHHLGDLQSFLNKGYLGHSNLKTESVKADCNDDMLLSLVCAVAVLYLRVTGPYWQLMESSVKHPDFHVYVQKMEACFDRWRADSCDLLDKDCQGVFDGEFEMDSPTKVAVLKFANEHSAKMNDPISLLMRDVLITTRTQLKDFLEGGKYSTPMCYEDQKTLQHCPLTNLMGENASGDMDFDTQLSTIAPPPRCLATIKRQIGWHIKKWTKQPSCCHWPEGRVCVSVTTTDSRKKLSPYN